MNENLVGRVYWGYFQKCGEWANFWIFWPVGKNLDITELKLNWFALFNWCMEPLQMHLCIFRTWWLLCDNFSNFCVSLYNIQFEPCVIYKPFIRPHFDYGYVLYDQQFNGSLYQETECIQYNVTLSMKVPSIKRFIWCKTL